MIGANALLKAVTMQSALSGGPSWRRQHPLLLFTRKAAAVLVFLDYWDMAFGQRAGLPLLRRTGRCR
jgi:hypothetical protein